MKSTSLAAALIIGALASISPAGNFAASTTSRSIAAVPNKTRKFGQPASFGYPNGPGWSVAQVKRMAQKRRNKARHKAACKGK